MTKSKPTVEELREAWRSRGWPEEMLERAHELRVRRSHIKRWAAGERWNIEKLHKALDRRARLLAGTMGVREATWEDSEALADLYANSPEEVGEWEVTVERGPYPFAQFRLQERAKIHVLEDGGVFLAAMAHSNRPSLVGGRPITVHISSAWRVREECRGEGYGPLVQRAVRPPVTESGVGSYYYRRDAGGRRKRRMSATVHCFAGRSFEGDARGIRLAGPPDIRSCIELINRTHQGLDLFRPYSDEYLQGKLDDSCRGPESESRPAVYGRQDYYLLEEGGRTVACAGLWDKGRHVREVWRRKVSGEQRVIESTVLLDFGYAEGREDAMARLIGYLIGVTDGLGRDQLIAPLEFLPSLARQLTSYEPITEKRAFYWQPDKVLKDLGLRMLARPYTDLAYW